jgi:hypothetical protein
MVTIRLAMFVTFRGPAKSFRRATVCLEFRHFELHDFIHHSSSSGKEIRRQWSNYGLWPVLPASRCSRRSFIKTAAAF